MNTSRFAGQFLVASEHGTQFLARPILNSPCDYPSQYWELDAEGQATQQVYLLDGRRSLQPPAILLSVP
jgi:hypothetical protein